MLKFVSYADAEPLLDWVELTDALLAGHGAPRARIGDRLLTRNDEAILTRTAMVDGVGIAVKVATVFPSNSSLDLPAINGAMVLLSDKTGIAEAAIDFRLVTKWKTAGDSLLAARLLARPDSKTILIVGAGTVARSLVEAYSTVFPEARFRIWNRTDANADGMAADMSVRHAIESCRDLEGAARGADIIACATMSCEPLIDGDWLSPGTHLDLIGAFRPDMREVDDRTLVRSRIFVDSRETAVDDIGELRLPLERGVISRDDIIADFYDVAAGASKEEATMRSPCSRTGEAPIWT